MGINRNEYVEAFMLYLLESADRPVSYYPHDYQKIAFLVDRNIKNKKDPDAKINFDVSWWGPHSTELKSTITTLACIELVKIQSDKNYTLQKAISPQEIKYFDLFNDPIMHNPFLVLPYIVAETTKYFSNKVRGKKNLPFIYKRAKKQLKEKFLGKDGVKEMESLVKTFSQTPIKDVYEQAKEIYNKEISASATA